MITTTVHMITTTVILIGALIISQLTTVLYLWFRSRAKRKSQSHLQEAKSLVWLKLSISERQELQTIIAESIIEDQCNQAYNAKERFQHRASCLQMLEDQQAGKFDLKEAKPTKRRKAGTK